MAVFLGHPMDFQDLMSRFAVALGIGMLIGLERAWRTRDEAPGSRTAGIRTFSISGLLGGIAGALGLALGGAASASGGIFLGLGLFAYAAVMAMFCREENRADGSFSATTAVAAIVTFALGAYALIGDMHAAAALAVATAAILALRERIHGFVAGLTWAELRSMLVILAMTFVALPLLPAEPIGPFGGVDLREIWIIAIVLAGVSFLGYAAVRYFGTRHGMLLAGIAGGLASSTAVTVTNARRAAAQEGVPRLLAAGVALASAVMFLRVIAIVWTLNAALLAWIAPALLAAAAAAVCFALVAAYGREDDTSAPADAKLTNPFRFWPVLGFAVFLGAIVLAGRALGESAGAAGTLAGAAIAGIADTDAIAVAVARLAPKPLSLQSAALAILTAVATNTLSKIAIGVAIGRGRFALEIAGLAVACFAAGGAALWLTFRLVAV
jgi:uncharacterized membrane protein (DUF4010 family)